MSRKSRPYRELLIESLTDPVMAAHYLNAASDDSQESYLKALRNVAQARQMRKVAEETGVQRESLYRILSEQGNPTLETLRGIYEALGLKLTTVAKDKEYFGPFGSLEIRELASPVFNGISDVGRAKNETASYAPSSWFIDGLTPNLNNFIHAPYAECLTNNIPTHSHGIYQAPSLPTPSLASQYWNDRKQEEIAA